MILYSARHLGSKPRVNEEITPILWKGIVNFLEKMEQRNYFAEEYPEGCRDNTSQVWAVDTRKLSNDLEIHTRLTWPLKTTHIDEIAWMCDPIEWAPTQYETFDVVEFLFGKLSTAEESGNLHTHFGHYHLSFPKNTVAQDEFSKGLNDLFCATGMIYEFDQTSGQVKTILGVETKELIQNALSNRIFDAEYQVMLHDACVKISSPRLDESYQALEKLWDAFERLKCYFNPQNQSEKRKSAEQIVALFFENSLFKQEVEAEMSRLTELGNAFRIRHSEPYQSTLKNHRQINYFFKRCLAMIVLIQEQIAACNSEK